jgi:hypothetical protein
MFEKVKVSINEDIFNVTDVNDQILINCSIHDQRLSYTTYMFQPEDRLLIEVLYKDDEKELEYTVRLDGLMKEFLQIIYRFEGQSLPDNISNDIKIARNPKFMQILSFINIVLIFYIEYVIAENPDFLKIGILQIGTTIYTQYAVFSLLLAPGIVMIAYTRILYTKIDGLIRYLQFIGPIKSYSDYSFDQGLKYFEKLSRWITIFVLIDMVLLLIIYSILIIYSQFLIGIVLFLLGVILPLKLLYSPIKFLLSKKDLQFYVGDYF